MSALNSIAASLNTADGRSLREIDQEILDELSFHLEMRAEDNIRGGMSPAEARSVAAEQFGDFERIRQTCRTTLIGERIMWQRFQTGLIVVLLLAVALLAFQVYSAQHANQLALAEVSTHLARISSAPSNLAPPATPGPPPEWAAERPRVVETFPADGATDVDPATKEIRVTFDKEMADGCWSWVRSSPDKFPESTGDVRYLEDMKTCVMPVQLKPGSKYVIWFNSTNYQNFKDRDGRPAVPQLLTFTTRD